MQQEPEYNETETSLHQDATGEQDILRVNPCIADYEKELDRALGKLRCQLYKGLSKRKPPSLSASKELVDKALPRVDGIAVSQPDEIQQLKIQLASCRNLIATLEDNERRQNAALNQSKEKLQHFKRTFKHKAHEKQEQLRAILAYKNLEISSLKCLVADLQTELGVEKIPPTDLQIEARQNLCRYRNAQINDTQEFPDCKCDARPDIGKFSEGDAFGYFSSQKELEPSKDLASPQQDLCEQFEEEWREWEKTQKATDFTIRELKVEREQLVIDYESLLVQLKQTKLERAVEAERYGEREMELKAQLRMSRSNS